MTIKILDRLTMGEDIDFSPLEALGKVEIFDSTEKDELASRVADADIVILNKVRIDRSLIKAMRQTKLICVFATGYDNIDVKSAKEYGIAVANVPGYSTESVTLHTVATVLYLISHLGEYREHVASGAYTSFGVSNMLAPVYHELYGKTWGIIGYGNIGKRVADIAKAFGSRALYTRKNADGAENCVDLDTLLCESDVVTVHCPLNESTVGLISSEKISLMKKSAVFVNEARGAVVDEYAVAAAVRDGKISGFGCDVYSVEPFSEKHPYYAIKDYRNVALTPHCAWAAFEARKRCLDVICENIKAYMNGKIKNRVDI